MSRPWTGEEDHKLRQLYARCSNAAIANHLDRSESAIQNRARLLGLRKDADFAAMQSSKHQFKKGQTPANKGKRHPPRGRAAETQFKPGNKPQTWVPIGSNRVSKEGYLQRKVSDTGCTRHDFVPVHRLVWRMHGRELPPGHALVFIDGNHLNVDINNLELISRAELMRRNSRHTRYPQEINELIHLRGVLNRKINARNKHEDECRTP